jgi:serine/threonine protein kinase
MFIVFSGLNLHTGEVVAVKKFERSKISPQQIGSVIVSIAQLFVFFFLFEIQLHTLSQKTILTLLKYEVELLQRLTHDNIVHILGKEEGERHLYLFME